MRLLLLLFLCDAAVAYDCSPTANISYDGSQYSYPESDDYHYGKNLNCIWTINVPSGMYATVTVNAVLTLPDSRSDTVKLNTDYKKTATLMDRVTDFKFNGVGSTINITLISNPTSVGTFSFTVDWYAYVQRGSRSYSFAANSYDVFDVKQQMSNNAAITITTENTTQIAISFDTDMSTSEVVIYDGDSTNAKFLGVLSNLYSSDHPVYSTGNSLALLYPLPPPNNLTGQFIANDKANVDYFTNYRFEGRSSVTEHYADNTAYAVTLFSSNFYTYYLVDVSNYNNSNCFISVNVGAPTKGAAVIAKYSSTKTANSTYPFPQQFVNGMITVQNRDCVAGTDMTFGTETSDDLKLYFGRTGYVFSNNYATNTTQFVRKTFSSAEKSPTGSITLDIDYADLNDNVTCQITIGNNTFGCEKIGTNVTMTERKFSVFYDSHVQFNGGLKLTYSFIEGTPTCPRHSDVSYNGTQYFYPQSDNHHYGVNLDCFWNIRIPSGMYATVTLNAVLSPSDYVNLETDYAKAASLSNNVTDYKFNGVGSIIYINLVSSPSSYGMFSFSVDWYPQVQLGSKSYSFAANSYQVFDIQQELGDNKAVTISTENNSQIAISFDTDMSTSSSEVVIYDGNSTNAKILGVLASLYSYTKPFYSTGNSLTFLYPLPSPNNFTGKFLANDQANVANLSSYVFTHGQVYVDLTSKNSAVTLYADSYDSYYLTYCYSYNNICQFSANVGAPTRGAAVIVDYSSNMYGPFPQQMVNGIITLRTNTDYDLRLQKVNASTQCDDDTSLHFDRTGYVFSNNYATNTAQFVNKTFVSSENTNASSITFQIDYADLNDNVACQITIGENVLGCTNIGTSVSVTGQTFTVFYDSHQTSNGGLKLSYSFVRGTSKPLTSTISPTSTAMTTRKATTVTTARAQPTTRKTGSLPTAFYCPLLVHLVLFMLTL